MGGSRKPDTAGAANGLALHPSCHAWIESNRKAAYTLGFLVGYGRPPEAAEVMLWSGWVLLSVDGSVSPTSATGVSGEASSVAEVHNVG